MASTNFKLFDENKTNMMSDTEYNINTQRLNGVQTGIASSQLQNKALYQTSLVAYSLAQIMMQNGYDASDEAAVSAFVGNMSNSLLQKVLDKATSAEAQDGTVTNKWVSPATMKAAALLLSGGTMTGPIDMGNNKITNLADPTDSLDSANKKYVDESSTFKRIEIIKDSNKTLVNGSNEITAQLPIGYSVKDFITVKFIELKFKNISIFNKSFYLYYNDYQDISIGQFYQDISIEISDLKTIDDIIASSTNIAFKHFYVYGQSTQLSNLVKVSSDGISFYLYTSENCTCNLSLNFIM